MKTKNNPEKRQSAIIEYLNKHGKVTTDEIRGILATEENPDKRIPKSTLSEDIKYLKSKGYPIVTSYGYISLDKQETNEEIDYCEKLSPSIIRKWIILYNAVSSYNYYIDMYESEKSLVLANLYNACKYTYEQLTGSEDAMSDQMFFRDVRELIRDGYIEYEEWTKIKMKQNSSYPNEVKKIFIPKDFMYFAEINKDTAFEYYTRFMGTELVNVFLGDTKEYLKKRWPGINNTTHDVRRRYYYLKPIPQAAMDMLKRIKALLYKSKALDVTCRSKDGKNTTFYKDFESLYIVYSRERKRLFLRGTCAVDADKEKKVFLLPLERIDDVQESATDNTDGKTVRYSDTYESANENDNPDVQKWKNRYEEVYCKEFEEDINESIPQTD